MPKRIVTESHVEYTSELRHKYNCVHAHCFVSSSSACCWHKRNGSSKPHELKCVSNISILFIISAFNVLICIRIIIYIAWEPPVKEDSIVTELYDVQNYIAVISTPTNQRINLTNRQINAIESLKENKDIIIKPADKGFATVSTNNYIREANRQLANTLHYAPENGTISPRMAGKRYWYSDQRRAWLWITCVIFSNRYKRSHPVIHALMPGDQYVP